MKPTKKQNITISPPIDEDAPNPNTTHAAAKRQAEIDKAKEEFFKNGGVVTDVDEIKRNSTEPQPELKRKYGRNYEL